MANRVLLTSTTERDKANIGWIGITGPGDFPSGTVHSGKWRVSRNCRWCPARGDIIFRRTFGSRSGLIPCEAARSAPSVYSLGALSFIRVASMKAIKKEMR